MAGVIAGSAAMYIPLGESYELEKGLEAEVSGTLPGKSKAEDYVGRDTPRNYVMIGKR